jgi:hypothetical protein
MSTTGRISGFLRAIRLGIVTDVPPEYQACESCRKTDCNTEQAKDCQDRLLGEKQEVKRRSSPTNG